MSIPVLPENNQSQKASQIEEWIEEVEKESIRLALDFEYMINTDISNFYGSIYTHSLSWALHTKEVSKLKRNYGDLLGNKIDHQLQATSNGQTNGIPTGSVLMDFIAELLLAFSDNELGKELDVIKDGFKILRYRDDYRIFTHNQKTGEEIIKILSYVLRNIGLSINSQKTCLDNDIIKKSIKPDKWYSSMHSAEESLSVRNFLHELLTVYEIAKIFPNSGSIQTRLGNLYDKYALNNYDHFIYETKEAVSILSNIAIECPRAIPVVAALISKAIKLMNLVDKKNLIDRIIRKLKLLPNSGLFEIWIQRIAHPNSITDIQYEEKLCQICVDSNISLFNTTWITEVEIKTIIDSGNYVLLPVLNSMDKEISPEEVALFREEYD